MSAFAHGKVILFGEHAVVHGYPALAAALSRGVHASATAAARDALHVPAWNATYEPGDESALARALAGAFGALPSPRPGLAVRADVELPAGAGVGCSAALGVAVLRALHEATATPLSEERLLELGYDWERQFHGNPSGVDHTVAAIGGALLFRRGAPMERIRPRHPTRLVVAYSGESASTRETVASVARQLERRPSEVRATFEAIETVVKNGVHALVEGDARALGQLAEMNHMMLASLMLSTERLERLCDSARRAGAYGAKLTGGGGGGCMLAVVGEDAEPVLAALRGEGADPFEVEVGR